MKIRPATSADSANWLRLRVALWPDGCEAEHAREIACYFAGEGPFEPAEVLLAEADGEPLGFVELSIRPYAEGCKTQRVAYLEGWYVIPDARRQGVGGRLIAAAEAWGREQGCTEFASDADPDNSVSLRAHLAAGFEDVGLVRCFSKKL